MPVAPVFGSGAFPFQPVWIEDVAQACAVALERRDITGTLELGGPDVITFEALVRAVGRAIDRERPIVHIPMPVARLMARLGNPLGSLAPITVDQLQMLVEGSVTPANAIRSVFGIQPLSFTDGLRRFLRA